MARPATTPKPFVASVGGQEKRFWAANAQQVFNHVAKDHGISVRALSPAELNKIVLAGESGSIEQIS